MNAALAAAHAQLDVPPLPRVGVRGVDEIRPHREQIAHGRPCRLRLSDYIERLLESWRKAGLDIKEPG